MTTQQRQRYGAALMRCYEEVTAIDALLAEYPTPDQVSDDRAALELEDLARRLAALTACRTPAGIEPKYTGGKGSTTSGDHSHSGRYSFQ